MDAKELAKLGGTVTKISVFYDRKISDGNYGSIGGQFGVEADLAAGADPDHAIDAIYAYVREAATRNLKPSFDAVKPAQAPLPTSASVPQEPVAGPPVVLEPKHAPAPISAPAAPIQPGTNERVLDIVADDSVQYKVLDSGKKLLLFKVGPFKLHGIDCWPEVAATWSEIGDWTTWQPAQPFFVQDFGIRQIVVAMKPSKNDPNKMTPDKVVAFR